MTNSAPATEMSCKELVELVTAYLEGALPDAQMRALEKHLRECDGCEIYLEQFRQTIGALGGLREGGLDAEVRARLLGAFVAMREEGRLGAG
jgi:anti-sigma factor RsiW